MNTLRYTISFDDGEAIDTAAADRMLGLGDLSIPAGKNEWMKIRPLFAASPKLLSVCVEIARGYFDLGDSERWIRLYHAISEAGGWNLLDPHQQARAMQEMAGPQVEPLTIAYVAMGAGQAIRACGHLPSEVADRYNGQLGFIEAVIDKAWRLDAVVRAIEANQGGLDGVYVYEVAEPFGERYAEALIAESLGKGPDANPDAIAQALFKDFMAQADTASGDYKALLLQGVQMGATAPDHQPPLTTQPTALDRAGEEARVEEIQAAVESALPGGGGDYDAGYRDALQSVVLALANAGVPANQLHDAVTTALDAFANNAPEAGRLGP